MANAVTEKYDEMVLEVETDTPGTYARICGMKDVTINRAAQLDSDEVPDCDDESKPFSIEKEVRSVTVTVAANGTWAQQSHPRGKPRGELDDGSVWPGLDCREGRGFRWGGFPALENRF